MTLAIALISPFIAAFLAHFLAEARMRKNDLSNFKLAAYSDFIISASRLAAVRRLGDTRNDVEDFASLNDAKNRILICGDRAVVEALIKFWKRGATLEKESELQAFKSLTQTIRRSLGYKKFDIYDLEISDTLFNLEPSTYSHRVQHCNDKAS
jgi:hypothetical protein